MRPYPTTVLTFTVLITAAAARAEGPPPARKTEPDKTVTNSLGMRLVLIPPGEFVMGLNVSFERLDRDFPKFTEASPYHDHRPRTHELTDMEPHRVRITKPFYMGVHEVTIGQFKRFVAETGFQTEPERDGTGGYGVDLKTKAWSTGRETRYNWRNTGFPQGDDHPVVNITWADAVAFCDWLGKKEGKKYRLPTEAEWEYACRAGATTHYSFGNDFEQLPRYANTFDASSARVFPEWARWAVKGDDGFAFTAPVGSFKPNPFGLYDMHGNVWEWCSDWYGENTYTTSALDDPKGPPAGGRRSRRGGGWHVWPLYCTSFYRNYNTPQSRYLNLGLRVVMDVP
jgi:formylglycine-generating enzyme required for sulfatase activity